MKRTFFKINGKSLVTAVFFISIILLTTITGSSAKNARHDIEIISSDSKSKVVFLGSTDNGLLFNVAVKNDNGDKFTLNVKNESGEILFAKEYSDINFDKNFKVIKGENSSRYYFNITSANKNLEQTFAVKTATRLVEDVMVTKL